MQQCSSNGSYSCYPHSLNAQNSVPLEKKRFEQKFMFFLEPNVTVSMQHRHMLGEKRHRNCPWNVGERKNDYLFHYM